MQLYISNLLFEKSRVTTGNNFSLFVGIAPKSDQQTLLDNPHKFSSPQVQKRIPKINRLITAKLNSSSFDSADTEHPSTKSAAGGAASRPVSGKERPTTAGRSRSTTAGVSRPITAGKSRPTTSESNLQDHNPPMPFSSNSSSRAADRPKSGTRPFTGSRPQSSRRSIASRKGKSDL